MTPEIQKILLRLARERWESLQRARNKMFSVFGPGEEWERYLAKPDIVALNEERELLAGWISEAESSPDDPDPETRDIGKMVETLANFDFSPYPGLYDELPWATLERVASDQLEASLVRRAPG